MRLVVRWIERLLAGSLLLVVTLLITTAPAAADKRVALLIGNSIHEHAPLLEDPADDARLLAETLTRLGFTLSGGGAQIDLDRQGFDRAIAEFKGRIADADLALIYYAGYGLQLNGTNYLVPVDAAPTKAADVETELRDLNAMLRELEGPAQRQNVVVLDAFRSNPFEARGIAGLAAGLAPMSAPSRTLICFAAQSGTIEQRGADGHGVFASALAEALQQPDRHLAEVFNRAGVAVKRITAGAQQPVVIFTPIDGNDGLRPPPTESATRPRAGAEVAVRPQTTAPSAGAPPDARTPGLAVLYDEDPADPMGKRYSGSASWRSETVKDGAYGVPASVIRADIDIPDRKLKLTIQLRRNNDPSMPASHLAELTFKLGDGFAGGGISNVPGILMKTDEKSRGTPLAGLAVKVTEGSFLVGLSNVESDRERNEQLLASREWLDIPFVYMNQRRGILAIAKGPAGDRAFTDTLAAWAGAGK